MLLKLIKNFKQTNYNFYYAYKRQNLKPQDLCRLNYKYPGLRLSLSTESCTGCGCTFLDILKPVTTIGKLALHTVCGERRYALSTPLFHVFSKYLFVSKCMMMKRSGPGTAPWGTRCSMSFSWEIAPFTDPTCVRFVR